MKNKKTARIPRSKKMICFDIIILLIICLLIQRPVAAYFSYKEGVLLTSLMALMEFSIDYCRVKRVREDHFTKEQYRSYLRRQLILLLIVFSLIVIVTWLIRINW